MADGIKPGVDRHYPNGRAASRRLVLTWLRTNKCWLIVIAGSVVLHTLEAIAHQVCSARARASLSRSHPARARDLATWVTTSAEQQLVAIVSC